VKLSKSLKNDSSLVTQRIYEKIRMAILTGEISAGERLVELDLATKMNSSRTPVREALQKIASEGLIYAIPRVGYIVGEMSESDLQDIFEARLAVEQAAAKLALERITPEELGELEMSLKNSEESVKRGVKNQMIGFDTEFHEMLCRASRNKRLIQFGQMLRDHLLKYRMIGLQIPKMARDAVEEHTKIFNALQSRDPKELERSISEHLETSKQNCLSLLEG